jgi:purine-cytosine permease-like protein
LTTAADATETQPRALFAVEARSIDYVPAGERHGRVGDQGPFWFMGNFQFFTITIGFIGPSLHLSLGYTALAAMLGILFGTGFQAFHASQGPELGLPQMVQSRAQFGYYGVVVPLFAALFTYIGFNVVDNILIADGLHTLWGADPRVVTALVALAAAVLAIWGHDWLHLAFKVLFWISMPLFTLLTIAVIAGWLHAPPAAAAVKIPLGFAWPAFLTQFAAAASYNITYAPYVSDYSRYLPKNTPRAAIIANVYLGSSVSAIWLICLGAWLAIHMATGDGLADLRLAGDLVFKGFGALLAFASICAMLVTMGVNAYSGMLTVVTGLDSLRPVQPTRRLRIVVIVVLAAVWSGLALASGGDAVALLGNTLVAMLYLLTPWTAVNLVDYFLLRHGHYAVTEFNNPGGIYGAFGVRGLTGYFAGFAASVPFFVIQGVWIGPAARALGGVDLAWLAGLVVAAVVYKAVSWNFQVSREQSAIAASETALAALDAASLS